MRKTRGFTLVELMIVVVVIGILAAIATPNMTGMRLRAREAAVRENCHTVQVATEDFSVTNSGLYPANIADVSRSGRDARRHASRLATAPEPVHIRSIRTDRRHLRHGGSSRLCTRSRRIGDPDGLHHHGVWPFQRNRPLGPDPLDGYGCRAARPPHTSRVSVAPRGVARRHGLGGLTGQRTVRALRLRENRPRGFHLREAALSRALARSMPRRASVADPRHASSALPRSPNRRRSHPGAVIRRPPRVRCASAESRDARARARFVRASDRRACPPSRPRCAAGARLPRCRR